MSVNIQELLSFLEVKEAGNWDNVQKHVRQLLLKYHPDVHQDNKFYYEEKTKKILHAYELLRKHVSDGMPLPFMPKPVSESPSVVFPSSFFSFQLSGKTFAFPVENVLSVVKADNLEDGG